MKDIKIVCNTTEDFRNIVKAVYIEEFIVEPLVLVSPDGIKVFTLNEAIGVLARIKPSYFKEYNCDRDAYIIITGSIYNFMRDFFKSGELTITISNTEISLFTEMESYSEKLSDTERKQNYLDRNFEEIHGGIGLPKTILPVIFKNNRSNFTTKEMSKEIRFFYKGNTLSLEYKYTVTGSPYIRTLTGFEGTKISEEIEYLVSPELVNAVLKKIDGDFSICCNADISCFQKNIDNVNITYLITSLEEEEENELISNGSYSSDLESEIVE